MITCRELIEVLLDFESGELAAEPREHVERHLEHCSSCVAFLETYRLTIKLSRRQAPGFEANDFDIQVEDHRLVMRASRKSETKEKDGQKVEERSCYQSITLPCDINKDKVDATYHNGVLTVTMPKTPEAKGRKIAVQGT